METCAELNELSNYPHLAAMCKGNGVRVTKVVFRGYFAAPKIQASHDEAIDKRTNLQLQVTILQLPMSISDIIVLPCYGRLVLRFYKLM